MHWHLDRLLKLPDMTVVKVQEIEGLIFMALPNLSCKTINNSCLKSLYT